MAPPLPQYFIKKKKEAKDGDTIEENIIYIALHNRKSRKYIILLHNYCFLKLCYKLNIYE